MYFRGVWDYKQTQMSLKKTLNTCKIMNIYNFTLYFMGSTSYSAYRQWF